MERIVYRKSLDAHKNGIQFTLQGFETADNMSRVIEIGIMASGDTIDIPLEGVVAMMYVTTPSSTEPSINHCAIRGNTIVYEVLPIAEEGTTEMQLKLIQSDINGAARVLISPRFAVEVIKSNADDGEAEQTATFTALENAVARANAVYDKRVDKIDVDPDGVFKVYYADGMVYESDAFRSLIVTEGTGLDMDSLIRDVVTDFTVGEVADYFYDKYKAIFAEAEMSSDLFSEYDKPTFVQWNSSTANTPYKEGLVSATMGFALVFGSTVADHTVIAWSVGDGVHSHIHRYVMGVDIGWDNYITASGGTMTGSLGLGGGKGAVSADDNKSYIESKTDSKNSRQISVSHNANITDAVSLVETVAGVQKAHKLFGEHNLSVLDGLGYAKFKCDSYTGDGSKTNKISGLPESAKFVLIADNNYAIAKMFVIKGAERSFPLWDTLNSRNNVTWIGDTLTLSNDYTSDMGSEVAMNEKDRKYWYVAIG